MPPVSVIAKCWEEKIDMKNTEVKVWDWSRYRFRLFRRFMDNSGTRMKLVCFDHQCFQSLCHCNSSNQKHVSVKIRIPKRGKNNEWKQLKEFIELGEGTEHNTAIKSVGINNLTHREKLMLKLFGRKPESIYAGHIKKKGHYTSSFRNFLGQ